MSTLNEKLNQHRQELQNIPLSELFTQEPERVNQWRFQVGTLYADLSKNHLNAKTKTLWQQWLEQAQVQQGIDALTRGDNVNHSENRPALHHRLRAPTDTDFYVGEENISASIADVRQRMRQISEQIHSGQWRGYSDQPISDVIHIGIGGSELGPRLLCHAFEHQSDGKVRIHFLASPDPIYLEHLTRQLNPATTLLIVASKSFSTEETLVNANYLRDWLRQNGGQQADAQMIAISANVDKAQQFGIAAQRILPFWDWVGGRFSLWSAISLPFVLQNGYPAYQALLDGAHKMDTHFQQTALMDNLPVQLALLDAWYNHYFAVNNRAVITYSHSLNPFPQYLQQLDMESLGKRANRQGKPLDKPSGLIIWGGSGTESQHAFFQLIHQGQRQIPIDFIAIKQAPKGYERAHQLVLGHCLAQSEALMKGRDESYLQDLPEDKRYERTSAGNRPSTTLILDALTPETLGALIALYEHKVSVLGMLYNVNAYDQWGVELGKILAQETQKSLQGDLQAHDPSTTALINHLKR